LMSIPILSCLIINNLWIKIFLTIFFLLLTIFLLISFSLFGTNMRGWEYLLRVFKFKLQNKKFQIITEIKSKKEKK
jgi:hypothetical protein